jgi:UDP-N-acetylglucosamine 4,6-dehydratase
MREKHSLDPINLNGKTVLVTGGTGSFGQRFTQLILERYDLKKLIVLSRDEHKQYTMQQCPHFMNRPELRFFIGDIRDEKRLRMAMRDVDYVVHAAAMKHVPTTEYNPLECIHTNIHGAENIVSASIDCGVKRVIALSTDKAVNPINIYGASKFAADKIFVASNRLSGDGGTKFSVVRYGNVIGSRGSIVPLIQRLIQDKAPSLPLTDRRMTRFWISLDQGINFVLSSVQLMKGGEIFVPKIPSMKIADMMNTLAPDIPVRVVGLRPGEKIHEVLVSEEDTATVLELDDRFIICPPKTPNIQTSHEQNGAIIAPAGLRYASNNNKVWLDSHGLKQLLPASPH